MEEIKSSISYFSPHFLAKMTDIPSEVYEALEGRDNVVVELVQKLCDGGLRAFAQEAIRHDGAAHFLAWYDGKEIELGDFLAYRQN